MRFTQVMAGREPFSRSHERPEQASLGTGMPARKMPRMATARGEAFRSTALAPEPLGLLVAFLSGLGAVLAYRLIA